MNSATVNVLLVEDDALDVEAVKRAFAKARIANPLIVAKDGIEAIQLLRGSDGMEAIKEPFLILLDINLPRMNGIELLNEIRNDDALCQSIVFVLTTSCDDRDIYAAYSKQVAGYVLKSKVGEDFMRLIGMLDHYWRIVEFPIDETNLPAVNRSIQ